MTGGAIYATGHIRTGGWVLGVTALFDVLDGTVARRTGRSTAFGAFYDSTLDRVADGFVLGGFAVFFATRAGRGRVGMVVVSVLGLIGTFSRATRGRAPRRSAWTRASGCCSAPSGWCCSRRRRRSSGSRSDGLVLSAILVLLTVTAWLTVAQRIGAVYRATDRGAAGRARGE